MVLSSAAIFPLTFSSSNNRPSLLPERNSSNAFRMSEAACTPGALHFAFFSPIGTWLQGAQVSPTLPLTNNRVSRSSCTRTLPDASCNQKAVHPAWDGVFPTLQSVLPRHGTVLKNSCIQMILNARVAHGYSRRHNPPFPSFRCQEYPYKIPKTPPRTYPQYG